WVNPRCVSPLDRRRRNEAGEVRPRSRPSVMPHEFLSLESLAVQLGRDRREVEKLVQRGRIPGHRVEGTWRFHPAEIRHWLAQAIRGYTSDELAAVESSQRHEAESEAPIAGLLTRELVQVPLEAR